MKLTFTAYLVTLIFAIFFWSLSLLFPLWTKEIHYNMHSAHPGTGGAANSTHVDAHIMAECEKGTDAWTCTASAPLSDAHYPVGVYKYEMYLGRYTMKFTPLHLHEAFPDMLSDSRRSLQANMRASDGGTTTTTTYTPAELYGVTGPFNVDTAGDLDIYNHHLVWPYDGSTHSFLYASGMKIPWGPSKGASAAYWLNVVGFLILFSCAVMLVSIIYTYNMADSKSTKNEKAVTRKGKIESKMGLVQFLLSMMGLSAGALLLAAWAIHIDNQKGSKGTEAGIVLFGISAFLVAVLGIVKTFMFIYSMMKKKTAPKSSSKVGGGYTGMI